VKDKKGRERLGLWKCYHCRQQLTVRKNTVFESSHLKLHQWFQAAYLLCSSKKGISSNQLARTLGCTVKTAWFASHRIREAMRSGELAVPFGTGGTDVEADETFIGREVRRHFARHGVVCHGQEEYVSTDDHTVHTNTVEGYFSIFKRGMKGVYQHCGKKHLHRYLAEFDFRYNNRIALGISDVARAEIALRGVVGKRLTSRDSLAAGARGVE
jgi:hypothetical protein